MRLTTFLWCSSSPVDILLRHTDQWVSDIHDFWLHWTEYHFRSPCLLLLYYLISLEDSLHWREIQIFSTCTSHLTAVAIFQGTLLFMNFRPSSSYSLRSDQIRSVAQSCLTLCNPMNRSTPGLPVHHQLPEFTETHIHRVSDTIQPSHPLSSPSPLAPQSLPASESFPMSQLFSWGGQSTGVSALASFLPTL